MCGGGEGERVCAGEVRGEVCGGGEVVVPHSTVYVQVKVGLKAKPSRTQWGKGEVGGRGGGWSQCACMCVCLCVFH